FLRYCRTPCFHARRAPRFLPAFPTRRSSDLRRPGQARDRDLGPDSGPLLWPTRRVRQQWSRDLPLEPALRDFARRGCKELRAGLDRKSTRLNSSHVKISYAVFCLKKKNKESN